MKTLIETSAQAAVRFPVDIKELFRARFRRALRACVRRRFSVAECFGVIWLETLESIPLNDEQQAELYDELICWAKHRLFPEVLDNSPVQKR